MHQQGFAGFQRAAGEDIGPDGEIGLRDGRRLDRRQTGGDRQRVGFMHDAIVGVAAAGDQRRDPRAQRIAGRVRAPSDHLAGDLEAERVARAGRRRDSSPALKDVGPVDARSLDPERESRLRPERDAVASRSRAPPDRPAAWPRRRASFRFDPPCRSPGLQVSEATASLRQSATASGAVTPSSAGAARKAGSASARAQNSARFGYRLGSTTSERTCCTKPKAQTAEMSATPSSPPIQPLRGSSASSARKPGGQAGP